jgi:hypothetical protein
LVRFATSESRAIAGNTKFRAPTALDGARVSRWMDTNSYGAAGLAAADAIGLSGAALAAAEAAALSAAEADAEASVAGALSSDLLQAVAKNIATSARSRTLRIFSSLIPCFTWGGNSKRKEQYDRRWATSSA